jgi:ATP-dependent Clp protease ATP-binding subunit ClpB
MFKPLTEEELGRIVDLQFAEIQRRLKEQDVVLGLTPEARAFIARQTYDPVYGARPLKRYLQKQVEGVLARRILAGEIPPDSRVTVGAGDGSLTFTTNQS